MRCSIAIASSKECDSRMKPRETGSHPAVGLRRRACRYRELINVCWLSCAAAVVASATVTDPATASENQPEVVDVPKVEVVGTTPLPGLGTALKDVPANVQIFNRRDFDRHRPLDLTDFLGVNANSVGVGSAQGNAYQHDISFRGMTASPLLGAPQGISVFQDGVRINEAFGDVINWDLLPQSAISSVQLIPGS